MNDIDAALDAAQAAWLAQLSNHTDRFGRVVLPVTPQLTERHLDNCRMVPSREHILRRMRQAGVVCEVGVQTGRFSQTILNILQPTKLHLLDLDLHTHDVAALFSAEIQAGVVEQHEGDSSTWLASFPDAYFDLVYIDGDHTYEGVKRDIRAARLKVKRDGYMVFNDYTYWSPSECMRYGVVQAVNELCIEDDWELLYFAFGHYMYCDVAVRRLQ